MSNFEVASFNSFPDIEKKSFPDGGGGRTSTIALSENAFAFRLKVIINIDESHVGVASKSNGRPRTLTTPEAKLLGDPGLTILCIGRASHLHH